MASVLIVDDEPDVRNALKIFLRPSGHDVAEASDAQAALTLMAQADAPPQVVLCDVHLRDGPNGLWLADRIRERHPTTAMILATGDATVPPVQSLRKGIVAYLIKPFRREDVVKAVDEGIKWANGEAKKAF
jgi:two-component system, chemotaxis family, CheB/CheR fusion protein